MISNKEKYINLSTQKKDGTFVNTPVWFVKEDKKNIFYVFSAGEAGKVKRVKNISSVKVAICNVRGDLRGDWLEAEAVLVDKEESIRLAYSHFHRKYGLTIKVFDFFSKLFGKYKKRQVIKFKLQDTD